MIKKRITSIFILLSFIIATPLLSQKVVRYKALETSFPKQTFVSTQNDLCEHELQALTLRKQKAHRALQQFTQQSFSREQTPTIGVACSGGGFRAAVATLGLLQGLEKIGLLDGVSYLASISGATWSSSSWLVHNYTLTELERYLREKLNNAFTPENLNMSALAYSLITKMQTTKKITLNDLWGGMLGNAFFSREKDFDGNNTYLSDLAPSILNAEKPIPLFSTVIGETQPDYAWAEFSPFQIGSPDLKAWIPSWAFGRKFNNGKSLQEGCPETYGYLLGMFGSAYAASVYDALKVAEESLENMFNISLPLDCFAYVAKKVWGSVRISPPQVYNFMYGMNDTSYKKISRLTFVDAGVDINLPFPPLLRRNVKVYIVCDVSTQKNKTVNLELEKAQQHAQKHGYPFPNFDKNIVTKEPCSIIIDKENKEAPIIIYLPNFTPISTLDLNYSEQDFSKVLYATKNTILENKEKIKKAVIYALTQ